MTHPKVPATLRRGRRLQMLLVAVTLLSTWIVTGLVLMRDRVNNGVAGLSLAVSIFTIAVGFFGLQWSRWLPYRSSRFRRAAALVSTVGVIGGIVPMYFIDPDAPIIIPPPFLVSLVAGGALLSLLTTGRVDRPAEEAS